MKKNTNEKQENMVKLIKLFYKTGNIGVLEQILKGVEPLMYELAKPYSEHVSVKLGRLDLNDFIQEARLSIIKSLKDKLYDEKKSSPVTYFYTLIKNKYDDLSVSNSSSFKFSRTAANKLKGINKYNEFINIGLSPEKALKKAKIKQKDLLKYTNRLCVSIDKQISDDSEETISSLIEDTIHERPGDSLIKDDFYNILKTKLTELEYMVIIANNVDNLSVREIAENNNMDYYKVKKALATGLTKLRSCKELKSFIGAFNNR